MIKGNAIKKYMLRNLVALWLMFPLWSAAQEAPKVTSEVDTTNIKIGEQLHYKITVEADSTDVVHFPEGQTFSPLETVEALKVDTTKHQDRVTLQRTYALTQFDSGQYVIPQQRIAINEKPFFTDSVLVKVADVKVDTVNQKMYDIKPLVQVQKSGNTNWTLWLWIAVVLLVIAGLLYWFVFRKKPLTQEEKEALLPPYDRALLELKKLENSKYLIQDEYKRYYSELTDIVRSYLEEDVHLSAMESTTDQLIQKLEMLRDSGGIKLEEDTLIQFKQILQTADLVKFARSKPPVSAAEEDRKAVEQIVTRTKQGLPEPTEEELRQRAEYLEEMERKKIRRKWYLGAAIVVGVLALAIGLAIAKYSFTYVRDTVFGHPTKELLEGEWVQSTYGYPPVTIETPQVLLRQEVALPPEAKQTVAAMQTFAYGSLTGLFSVTVSTATYNQADQEPDFDKAVEGNLKAMEGAGVKNLTTKQEEFTTVGGVKGIKIYGSGQFPVAATKENQKAQYTLLCFGGKGFMQQVMITWPEGDTYAEKIVDRILASVDVKTE